MQVKIFPSIISGAVHAPPSKSSMQRACAAALLHSGITRIKNAGTSNDDKTALSIISLLGARWENHMKELIITSEGFPATQHADENKNIACGESGLSVRMFAPIAALSSSEIIMTGEGSLLKRPMGFFDEVLPQLGVRTESDKGHLPIKIKGPLVPQEILINGSLSSQFLTGLLFVFGKAAEKQVIISVNNLKSKPYIDLTMDVMRHFGYLIMHKNHEHFIIDIKPDNSGACINYTVEGDWSSASFLLVAAAIAGSISVSGLDINSSQADKAISEVLRSCGAEILISGETVDVRKKDLNAFSFDATDCPDLFPPLVALAACCKGNSVIKGIHRLAAKESNRAETLKNVFELMGIGISLQGDEMIIVGGSGIKPADVSSHHDHRIAMAAAVAALGAEGAIVIDQAEAINKSYPDFFKHLKKVGAVLEIREA